MQQDLTKKKSVKWRIKEHFNRLGIEYFTFKMQETCQRGEKL